MQAGIEDKTLIVGFDAEYPPYGYMDENGEYTGFDLELAQEVAKSLAGDYVNSTVVDTIVCMDGTEVVGAYLAQEFENAVFATLTCMIRFMWSHRSIMRTIS